MQAGTAVHTVAAAQIVAVVIVIVDAADVGHQAGPALAAADAFGLHAVADILAGRGRKIGSVAGQVIAVLVIDFITQQSVEVVDVAQGLVVGQLVGPDEFVQFMGLDGHLAVDVVAIGRAGVRPVFTLGVDKVIGYGALELEVRDDLILRPGRVERAGNPVFLVVVGLGKQRVAVAVADEIAVPGTVLVVDRVGRHHAVTGGIERRGIGGAFAVDILLNLGEQDVGSQGQAVGRHVLDIDAGGQALHLGSGRDAVLVQVVQGREILEAVRTAGQGSLIVGMTALAEKDLVPVDIAAPGNRSVGVDFFVGIGLRGILGLAFTDGVVVQAGPHVIPALLAAHDRTERHGEVRLAPVCLETDLRLAGLALLGRDDDHAVRRTRAVQGSRRGVLDDGDVFDVAVVQGGHDVQTRIAAGGADVTAAHRNAVDDIERRVAGIERAHTADVQAGGGTRLAGGLAELHARGVALQHVLEGNGRYIREPFLLHAGSGTGVGRFFEGTVTGHDDLVHQDGVGIQLDGKQTFGSDADFLVDIAQAGHDEGHRQGRDLQGEASVNIRRRTLAGTFHHDTRADDRLLRLCIGDDALQAGRCRPSRFTEPQTGKQHQAAAKKISPQRFDVCRF